jgi:hypothetical protein
MVRISVRTSSSPARRSTGSPCAAPRGRSKGGKPLLTGPTLSPSARLIGSSGRPGARRARSRPSGGSMLIARASRRPSSASASRIVAPVKPGRCARGRRRRGAACIFRRRSALRRSRWPGLGRQVRTGSSSINAGRGSKGGCRKACGPSAYDGAAIGVERKHLCSTWPPPLRSTSIGLSPGWRNGHGPRRGPRALQPWRLCMTCPRRTPPSKPRIYSSPRFLRSVQTAYFYFILREYFM